MVGKSLLKRVFSQIRGYNFLVRYWDGEEVVYGQGEPDFQLVFCRKPGPVAKHSDISLLFGEAYIRGDLDITGDFDAIAKAIEDGDSFFYNKRNFIGKVLKLAHWRGLKPIKAQQKRNIAAHYDLGNDFFSLWLDPSLSYSCAYFKDPADSLAIAQDQKIDLVLRKAQLKPGMRLLDIGCGWGHLALRAARDYGVSVLGVTLSAEQCAAAKARARQAGLSDQVEIRLENYRDLTAGDGPFDRIVSVGMFEHVGRPHIPLYLSRIRELLRPGGLSVLHTLTKMKEDAVNGWTAKYIFPGGYIPSLREIIYTQAAQELHVLHVESLRPHYAKTLDLWYDNFSRPEVIDKVRSMFGEEFVRMWSLYLRMAASFLRTGYLDVHQIVFSSGVARNLPLTLESVYCH